jgi:hypothetical protein
MPVDVRLGAGACTRITPTREWQMVDGDITAFGVDRDYYVRVRVPGTDGPDTRMAEADCGT